MGRPPIIINIVPELVVSETPTVWHQPFQNHDGLKAIVPCMMLKTIFAGDEHPFTSYADVRFPAITIPLT